MMALSTMELSIMTLSIMTDYKKKLSIITLSMAPLNVTVPNSNIYAITNKQCQNLATMLGVVKQNVICFVP
jgi:hypothetical protein